MVKNVTNIKIFNNFMNVYNGYYSSCDSNYNL